MENKTPPMGAPKVAVTPAAMAAAYIYFLRDEFLSISLNHFSLESLVPIQELI